MASSNISSQPVTLHDPLVCRICVQGVPDPVWIDQMPGMHVLPTSSVCPSFESHKVTVLLGQISDQAALMGVLNELYSLGLPIVSVECVVAQY